jgi:heat shock protein HslJ
LASIALFGCATTGIERIELAEDAYAARGTEPFWSLSIDPRVISFRDADDHRVVEQTPRKTIDAAGERYAGARLKVAIVHGRCSDGMSDNVYPDQVQLSVDGRALSGCGGKAIAPGELAGTNWTVDSVGGTVVPGGAANFVRFTGDAISARFGCNTLNGRYAVSGITLSVGPLAATRMACPDMAAEQQAQRILAAPATLAFDGAERLRFGGPAGVIVLKRVI